MPELPEVQTIVNTLRPRILGRRIESVNLLRPDMLMPAGFDLANHLSHRKIADVSRRGKRIVFTLDSQNCFYIHLGMTGRLTVEPTQAELLKHTHLVLQFHNFHIRLRDPRRFGGIFWLGKQSPDEGIGPEPLTIQPVQLAARLARISRAIKNALLDQRLIAGLGNIYVDESLFAAGVHPLRAANKLSNEEIRRLTRAIKLTLRQAIRHRGSTLRDYVDAEGGAGAFQKLHRVYDRAGEPCQVCQSSIKRIVLASRSTCFCPQCQPSRP
jgi:formamidopyrimidine-DNA glycosylase